MPGESALQATHLLANGRYSVALRANGAGWSRSGAADVSRWRDDALRDAHGSFFYLRRHALAAPVSITQHPAPDPAAHYQATFHGDRVCLDAEWSDLRTRCTVWVSPEDDIELRRIEFWNTSSQALSIELMSMFEVSLSDARADEAHPVFANLFVQADWDADDRALYFARRPRRAGEEGLHAVHFIAHSDAQLSAVRAQSDRARWLGRNREASHPLAHYDTSAAASGERATGLDPVAALSMRLTLPAHATAQVTFGTAAATGRAALETLVDRYAQASIIERSSLMSATLASIRLREMRINPEELAAIQTLTTALALLLARPEPPTREPQCDRRALWRFGISGDRPLIVVGASAVQGLRLVRSLVQALRLWSWGGLACDLVVVNSEPRSYLNPLQLELAGLRDRYAGEVAATAPARACGLHVFHADDLSAPERATLATLARVRLNADGRPLSHHVQDLVDWHDDALDARLEQSATSLPAPAATAMGGAPRGEFDAAGGGFRFSVTGVSRPRRPWVNVLANPGFGAQVSEAGGGYTWAGNSSLHQLTPWSNDPVADACGEGFFVQDLRTREVWNVAPGAGTADVIYSVEHGQGLTMVRHRRGDLEVATTWCVDATQSVKHVRVALRNQGTRSLRLRVVGVLEWVLGTQRSDRQSVRTAFESLPFDSDKSLRVDVLLATQCDGHAGFGGSTAFFAVRCDARADASLQEWTCDRRELFDARGQRVIPDHFNERAGPGLDPCAAAAASLALAPGEDGECIFVLGHGETPAAARALARVAVVQDALLCERDALAHWDELLGAVSVHTPDPLFDALAPIALPQLVPSRICLQCDVCCRFPDPDSALRPYCTETEITRALAGGSAQRKPPCRRYFRRFTASSGVKYAAPGSVIITNGQWKSSAAPRFTRRIFGSFPSSLLTGVRVSSDSRIERLMSARG